MGGGRGGCPPAVEMDWRTAGQLEPEAGQSVGPCDSPVAEGATSPTSQRVTSGPGRASYGGRAVESGRRAVR